MVEQGYNSAICATNRALKDKLDQLRFRTKQTYMMVDHRLANTGIQASENQHDAIGPFTDVSNPEEIEAQRPVTCLEISEQEISKTQVEAKRLSQNMATEVNGLMQKLAN